VPGGVDALRLGERPVVEPEDDVPDEVLLVVIGGLVGKVRCCDGDRLVRVVGEDGERAGRVEADALDGLGRDGRGGEDPADAFADGAPDVGGGLFLGGGVSGQMSK
jgi:hypothetical protein